MIPVLNRKTDKIPKGAMWVGRPTMLGNPFPIRGAQTREIVIAKYEEHFNRMVSDNRVFIAAVRNAAKATALV